MLLDVSGKMKDLVSGVGMATHDAWNACSVQLVNAAKVRKVV